MKNQQRPWASRLEKAASLLEDPNSAPDSVRGSWLYKDEELDDHGNPIVYKGPRPWAERLERLSCDDSPEAVQALLRQPFSNVLAGAALCAGQPYLLWNIQTFLNSYLAGNKIWLRYGCGVLMNRLRAANGAVVRDSTTTDVLFHLLVEPFALMNEMRK